MRQFDPLVIGFRNEERRHQTPSRSPLEGQATDISAQQRAGQGKAYDTAQGTFGQFEGPVTSSPFYKALLTSGTDAATTGYEGAKSASLARGKRAGFGATQPITDVAQSGIESAEASTLAGLPAKAAAVAAPLSLEAAKGTESMGTELGREGADYFKSGVGLEEQYQNQLAAQQQALWNAIAQVPQDLMLM